MLRSVLILLLQVLLLLSDKVANAQQGPMCREEHPKLGAGHIVLTDQNYAKWRKDNEKLHVLGIGDS